MLLTTKWWILISYASLSPLKRHLDTQRKMCFYSVRTEPGTHSLSQIHFLSSSSVTCNQGCDPVTENKDAIITMDCKTNCLNVEWYITDLTNSGNWPVSVTDGFWMVDMRLKWWRLIQLCVYFLAGWDKDLLWGCRSKTLHKGAGRRNSVHSEKRHYFTGYDKRSGYQCDRLWYVFIGPYETMLQ